MRQLSVFLGVVIASTGIAHADLPPIDGEIYGFVMLDTGYDFGSIGDPNWFDTLRPTKLPAFEDQYGRGGRWFAGVRQTRFGSSATAHTDWGDVYGKFEWELFGVGPDQGQTTIRLRHAYVDWQQLRAGQTWSPFMDIDLFPNSIEYWGPNGMAFYRNVQVAWMPIQGESRVTVAVERPGASPDTGIYTDHLGLEDVVARFPAPDISAEGRFGGDWGYVELAGILRYIRWDDLGVDPNDISDHVWGWGFNLSSNLKLGPATLRLGAVYGHGIANYMNDATADVAIEVDDDTGEPEAVALPLLGVSAFADITWNESFSTAVGYSFVNMFNTDGQAPDAFHLGQYALVNIMMTPVKNLMLGPEFQWGRRSNNDDGFDVNDFRLQFSVKGSFSTKQLKVVTATAAQ